MNLEDVRLLVEAVRGGSLASAARRLEVTPMLASRRLAVLEAELGVRLLHRSTRSMALTTEGEAFFPHAEALLEEEDNGRAAVRPSGNEAAGLLRLTTSAPFGRKVVAPMLPALLRAHPKLRVDLLMTDDIVDIVGTGLDLAIRIAPLKDSRLVARKLADSPRSLYASPAYLKERGAPVRLAELADHACLAPTGTSHWTFVRTGSEGKLQQRIECRFTASSIEGLIETCAGGMGIANVSHWAARAEVRARKLVPVTLEDASPAGLGIWAVFPSARLVAPKVTHFLSALEKHLHAK